MTVDLRLGDCAAILPEYADNSIDAIVTDPPYGLSDHSPADVIACLTAWLAGEPYTNGSRGFMGATWDSWVPGPEIWRECYRVLKPGGHILCFAGTRTDDLMGIALRLAGFQCRDKIIWCYGSGFPKSANVSKMLDRAAGVEREDAIKGGHMGYATSAGDPSNGNELGTTVPHSVNKGAYTNGTPATDLARQFDGFGTALKPAYEPVILARKPLIGSIAENVTAFGTGGLNIAACRIGTEPVTTMHTIRPGGDSVVGKEIRQSGETSIHVGRWPANLTTDGSAEVRACFPETTSGRASMRGVREGHGHIYGNGAGLTGGNSLRGHDDNGGSAARFFYAAPFEQEDFEAARLVYVAKASRKDREEGCEGLEEQRFEVADHGMTMERWPDGSLRERVTEPHKARNVHPTVKPVNLCKYLCRLITHPGGVVLDPFMGSGSIGKGAVLEGFSFIGIELDESYYTIAQKRIAWAERQPGIGL